MNKGYTYVDGKVIISDTEGKQVLDEYYDNLDDVLVQENLIETMENRITELEKYSELCKKVNPKHYRPIYFIMIAIMTTIVAPMLSYLLTGTNPFITSIDTIFGIVNDAVFEICFFSSLLWPLGALLEFNLYRQYKNSIKKENGVNSELEFLQKQIVEEKRKLEDLKKEKKKEEKVKDFKVVEVDDKQQLNALKSYLSLYFDLGYNVEKYFSYYQQGKLDEKLGKCYTDTDIGIAKEYLEEKGPTLVKRKKQNNQNNS